MAGDQLASRRRRLGLGKELLLALAPTATVLLVLALVEAVSQQRLLFASLAWSAFPIYLDPGHSVNQARTLVLAQMGAAVIGLLAHIALGPGYASAGLAMIAAIVVMIVFDAVHPPAVSTALSFGLRADDASNLLLFFLALGITVVLLGLQRLTQYMVLRSLDNRRAKVAISDTAIRAKVKTALLGDPDGKWTNVNVETFRGTVQLSGFVDSPQNAARAAAIGRRVEGVIDVRNALIVK